MFEGIIASVLNKVLGDYVANLETKQLNIGIWKGDVTLHNLQLRTDALDRFDLPLDVTFGNVGELKVKIPWTDLKNQPLLIELNDVLLLSASRAETVFDPALDKLRKLASKMAKLDMAESMSAQLQDTAKFKDENAEAQQAGFTAQLLTKIMDNLQISINNLHIKYEDTVSGASGTPFSIGIMLSSVSAVSNHSPPNANKLDLESPEPGDIRKLLGLEELSVYLRINDELLGHGHEQTQVILTKLKHDIKVGDIRNGQFVLEPVSGRGHVTLHRNWKKQRPKTRVTLDFDQLAFGFDAQQYQTVLQLAEMLTLYMKNQKYRPYRPPRGVGPKQNPKLWFQYAINCVRADVSDKLKVWSWPYLKQRRDQRKRYVELYIRSKNGTLDPASREDLKQLDESLSYSDLRFYRSLATRQVRSIKLASSAVAGDASTSSLAGVSSWVSSWWSPKNASSESVRNDLDTSLSEEDVKRLYEAVEFDPATALRNMNYPANSTLLQVDFQLASGSFSLKHGTDRERYLMKLDYNDSRISFIKKPASFLVNVQLQTTSLMDGSTPNTLYPQLIRAKSSKHDAAMHRSNDVTPFFVLNYEMNPDDSRADHALSIKMTPLEVVWNRAAVLAIKRFFTPVHDSEAMRVLWSVAEDTIEGLKTQTRASLEFAIAEHKMIDLQLEIQAPVFLFPESVTDENSYLVVLDAGKFRLQSELVGKDKKKELQAKEGVKLSTEDWNNLRSLLYDKFNCSLTSAQLVVGRNLQKCLRSISSSASPFTSENDLQADGPLKSTPFHVVDRVNLQLQLHVCIMNNAPSLPNLKIFGQLPRLHVNLSDLKWKAMIGTIEQVVQTMTQDFIESSGKPRLVQRPKSVVSLSSTSSSSSEDFIDALEGAGDVSNMSNDVSVMRSMKTPNSNVLTLAPAPANVVSDVPVQDDIANTRTLVEFNFTVDEISACVGRGTDASDGTTVALAEMKARTMLLRIDAKKHELLVDFEVGHLDVIDKVARLPAGQENLFQYLVTSECVIQAIDNHKGGLDDANRKSLAHVVFVKYDKESPNYTGVDANLDIKFADLDVLLNRESILTIYDWIMTTFVPDQPVVLSTSEPARLSTLFNALDEGRGPTAKDVTGVVKPDQVLMQSERLAEKVVGANQFVVLNFSLSSLNILAHKKFVKLVTGQLEDGHVCIVVNRDNTVVVEGELGNLLVFDEKSKIENCLVQLEKTKQQAHFVFRNCGDRPEDRDFDSSFQMHVPSMRLLFAKDVIIEVAEFFADFAKMHALLETARRAAKAGAATIQDTAGSRLKLDITVDTPIIEFPRVQYMSDDVLVAYLGELSLKNEFLNTPQVVCTFDVKLEKIKLISRFFINGEWSETSIVKDLTVSLHGKQSDLPQNPLLAFNGSVTDVSLNINERQYAFIREFIESFAGAGAPAVGAEQSPSSQALFASTGNKAAPTARQAFDLIIHLPTVQVSLVRGQGLLNKVSESPLAKFTVHKTSAKVSVGRGIGVEVAVRAFQVQDIRPEYDGIFRELLPVTMSNHDQLLVKFENAGLPGEPPRLSVDLDSPKFMLLIDHVVSLVQFVTKPCFYVPMEVRTLDQKKSPNASSLTAGSSKPNLPHSAQLPPLFIHVNLVDFEAALLADGRNPDTEAIILASHRLTVDLSAKTRLEVSDMGVFVCVYSKRKTTQLRVISNFQLFMHASQHKQQMITVVEAELSPLVVRVSYKDVLLFLSVVRDISSQLANIVADTGSSDDADSVKHSASSVLSDAASSEKKMRASDSTTSFMWVSQEKASFSAPSIRLLLIDDLLDVHIPMLDCTLDQFIVMAEDWSSHLSLDAGMSVKMNSFNIHAAAWEPVVEPWECSLHVGRRLGTTEVEFFSRKRLDIDITSNFIASIMTTIKLFKKLEDQKRLEREEAAKSADAGSLSEPSIAGSGQSTLTVDKQSTTAAVETPSGAKSPLGSEHKKQIQVSKANASVESPQTPNRSAAIDGHRSVLELAQDRGVVDPYIIKNETGYTLHLWNEAVKSAVAENAALDASKGGFSKDSSSVDAESRNQAQGEEQSAIHVLKNGESMKWRFVDWIAMREATEPKANVLALQIEGPPFETLKNVGIDKFGDHVYVLRPKVQGVAHRLVCSVSLENYVRYVTFRSGTVVKNSTKIAVDVRTFSDSAVCTLEPGQQLSIPIIAAYKDRIQIRPSGLFGYGWTNWDNSLFWADIQRPSYSTLVECRSPDVTVPGFRFQICTEPLTTSLSYPLLTIHLYPPLRIENLLPLDIRYIIFDKTARFDYRDTLAPGEADPIHTVNPLNTLGLSIDIPQSDFHPSEAAIISSEDQDFRDVALVVYDSQKRPLELRLNYMDKPKYGGRRVSIYAPYMLVNKTTIQLLFRAKSIVSGSKLAAGQTVGSGFSTEFGDDLSTSKAKPLMFSYTNFQPLQSRAQVRVPESGWSTPISFEAVGSSYECVIPTATLGLNVHLGVSISEGADIFYLTKVVTFVPRFVIVNKLGANIQIRQHGTSAGIMVPVGKSRPLLYLVDTPERQFCLRLTSTVDEWSAPINLEDIGRVYVRLSRLGDDAKNPGVTQLVAVDIAIEGACIFVRLSMDESQPWPFSIENLTDIPIMFHQTNVVEPRYRYCVQPQESLRYAWDFPSLRHRTVTLIVGARSCQVPISEIGPLYPFEVKHQTVIALDVLVRGRTLVLRLSPYRAEESIFKRAEIAESESSSISLPRVSTGSLPNSTTADDERQSPTQRRFQVVDTESQTKWTFQIRLEGIGVSLIDNRQHELVYATFKGVDFMFRDIQLYQTFGLTVQWVQFDNQTAGAVEPIMLYPTVVPNEGKDVETRPIVQAALVRSKDESYGVEYFKYFTLLVQELSIVTDEDLLFSLVNFTSSFDGLQNVEFSSESALGAAAKANQICSFDIDWKFEPPERSVGTPLYFEVLQIQPIKLNVSFSRTEQVNARYNSVDGINGERTSKNGGVLHVIFDVLTMTVGSIHDAPLRLTSLVVEHPFVTSTDLADLILQHYAQQAMGQLHKVLGSADFLGNPVGLFNTISSGVSDMFYEPLQGFVSDRPQDLGIGLAKGTASFMKKTVYGFSDTFSKFTGSVGKGLSVATLDRDFQEKRRIAKTRNRPKHAMYGVTVGISSLARSMGSAISGVVVQPLEGAEREGFGGFFKGVGKGLVGAVTKPVVGMLDLASSVTEGIKNTTTVFERDIDPVRLPRFVDTDGILRPYNAREALGLSWARSVDDGKFQSIPYVAHLELAQADLVAIALKSQLLLVKIRKLSTEWVLNYEDIQTIKLIGAYSEMQLQDLSLKMTPSSKTRSSSIVDRSGVVASATLSDAGTSVMVPSQDSDAQDPVELFVYLMDAEKRHVPFRKLVFTDVSSGFWFKSRLERAVSRYNEENRPLD